MAKKNKRKSQSQRIRDVFDALHRDGENLHLVSYRDVLKLCRRKLKGKEARESFAPERSLVSMIKRRYTGGWGKAGRPSTTDLANV